MFKKAVMTLVIGTTLLQATAHANGASNFESTQQQRLETDYSLLLNPLACFHFGGCAAVLMNITGVSSMMEYVGHKKAQAKLVTAVSDAEFFKARVISVERGDVASSLYKRVVIKADDGDVMTIQQLVSDGSTSTYQDVAIEVIAGEMTFDNYSAGTLKINGRQLISKALSEAHLATQGLIYDDVIMVDESIKANGSVAAAATSAVVLNDLMLNQIRAAK